MKIDNILSIHFVSVFNTKGKEKEYGSQLSEINGNEDLGI